MKYIIGLFLMLNSTLLMANKNTALRYDYRTDSLTYAQYQASNWEALLTTAKDAKKENIGFYYLTLRVAYASFYTQRYNDALRSFDDAEAIQNSSPITKELHYLAALYAARVKQTEYLYTQLSKEQQERYKAPTYKRLKSVAIDYGYSTNKDFNNLLSQEIDGGHSIFGERIVLKNMQFQDYVLQHSINSSLTIGQAFEHLKINKQQSFYYQDYTNNTAQSKEYTIATTQWQYHINAAYNIDDRLFILPAFSLLHFDAENVFGIYNSTTNEYDFTNGSITDYQFLYSLGISYRLNKTLISLSTNRINSGNNSRGQYGGEITYYPFSNKQHYITGGIYHHDSHFYEPSDNWQTIWKIEAGWNISKVWMAIVHSQGDHTYFADNNGLVVYNTYENILSQTGGNIHLPLFANKLWLNIYYRYLEYQSAYFYMDDQIDLQQNATSHHNHSITGGLSWQF